jgi:D-tyrosyl-tRNA(Tyr) deacylase
MRCILQRVLEASVKVENEITGSITTGLMILVGFEEADNIEDLEWTCGKIVNMRIFNDENGVMPARHNDISRSGGDLSIKDIDGNILLVSQFTLHAQTKKGNRPSYIKAAKREIAIPLYEHMKLILEKEIGRKIESGIFGADMKVSLINDGPVTIILDSKNKN